MNKKLFLLIPACLLMLAACNPQKGGESGGQGSSGGETSGDTSSGESSSEREHVNYGSAEAPLDLATLVQEVEKLAMADYEYSPQHFFISATLPSEISEAQDGRFSFVWTEGQLNMKVNNVTPKDGETRDDYIPGDVCVIEGYVRHRTSGYEPTGYYMTYNSTQGVANPAPSVVSVQHAQRPAVESVTIDPTGTVEAPLQIRQGDTRQLSATLAPKYSRGTVVWSSSRVDHSDDEELFSVSQTGLVTVAAGAVVDHCYTVTATVGELSNTIVIKVVSGAAPIEYTSIVKYDLSNWDKGNNAASSDGWTWGLTPEHALQIFDGTEDVVASGTPCITAAAGNKWYACPADQGPGKGIKLGSSSAEGYITLTSSKDVSKIVFKVKAWNATKLAEIKFNDTKVGDLVAADATTPREFTVEMSGTKTLKISSSIYSCLVGVELFEVAPQA